MLSVPFFLGPWRDFGFHSFFFKYDKSQVNQQEGFGVTPLEGQTEVATSMPTVLRAIRYFFMLIVLWATLVPEELSYKLSSNTSHT